MNPVNKIAGMAGFLYVIYRVIHLSAGVSQQEPRELQELTRPCIAHGWFFRKIPGEGDADENTIIV